MSTNCCFDHAPAALVRGVSMPGVKTCASCYTDKPLTAFLPARSYADGLTSKCLACIIAAAQSDREQRERKAASRPTKPKTKRKSAAKPQANTRSGAKACIVCKTSKPLVAFGKHARSKDGHRRTCCACVSAAGQRTLEELADRDRRVARTRLDREGAR